MRLLYFLLFISSLLFAQKPEIKVTITSIKTVSESKVATEYHINYQIENKTSNELSFFLIPHALIANTAASLTLYPIYKMYQNNVFEDMDGPFFEYETDEEIEYAKMENKTSPEAVTFLKNFKNKQSVVALDIYNKYKSNGGKSDEFSWIYQRNKILNNVVVLKPNETKAFTIKTIWNNNRFIKNDDLEYYLDAKNTIEIELILDLKTTLFKDLLTEEDLMKINANPSFIKGEFVSNKMKIDFKN